MHRTKGVPKFIHGHHPNPLRRGFEALRGQGYKLVSEVATELGVSATTFRRMEEEGVIPKAKRVDFGRGRSVRVYKAEDVKRIASSKPRERWLAKHPGQWAR
ncbi:MAG TPA: MerR family transcriptional regulator [Kofleriaceae bacterium]|nr:MerR family transcriptional regulator [Kofleriaceae bacterium]